MADSPGKKTPDKRQPYDPAKAMRERAAAAEAQRATPTLTNAQKLAGRPLLRPEKPVAKRED